MLNTSVLLMVFSRRFATSAYVILRFYCFGKHKEVANDRLYARDPEFISGPLV